MTSDIAIATSPLPSPSTAIRLTPEQTRALDSVARWLKSHDGPVYKLFGCAGVGKSTIARYVADSIDGSVAYVAYTGRACDILRRRGMPARTVHSALYLPISERSEELGKLRDELAQSTDDTKSKRLIARIERLSQPQFVLRSDDPDDPRCSPLIGCDLIIADEMSMLSKQEADDLLSFDIPLLVLGDPGQLPPIEGRGHFSTGEPDFLLTEIHRQALDSPIIQLATAAREGRPLKLGSYGSSAVIQRRAVERDLILGVSQVLCGSNKTRLQLIEDIRGFQGHEGLLPLKSEKLICLRNNPRTGLFNGSELVTSDDVYDDPDYDYFVRVPTERGEFKAYRDCFERPEHLRAMAYGKRAAADEFDFAACLTVHKAQGGQWPSVLFWNDGMWRWDPQIYRRLIYTALTRAEDRIVVAI